MNDQNPSANVPKQRPTEPLGDRGQGDKTWTPEPGEQGISNRVNDEEPEPETDSTSFGQDGKDVVSIVEEDPTDDEEFEEDDDDLEDEGASDGDATS